MSLDREALVAAVSRHGPVARVLVAETQGSVPREAGTAMLVWPTGQAGTIGGGALELAATEAARRLLQSSLPARISRHPLGPDLGQCCGGAVTLVTEIWDKDRVDRLPTDRAHLRRITGDRPAPLALRRLEREARRAGATCDVALQDGWLLEPLTEPDRALWVFGAGHVGRALIGVLAPLPGLAITWVDTGPDRFPAEIPSGVSPLVAAAPHRVVAHAPDHAEHLVLTYSHALDLEICHAILSRPFRRAGLIGSATKWARFRRRLAQLGHGADQIGRIDCPIGDPNLGKDPQSIAIGVAASFLGAAKALAAQHPADPAQIRRRP